MTGPGSPPVLVTKGTLPIEYKGVQYNIPVHITIPEGRTGRDGVALARRILMIVRYWR